ncbi:MAG: hypothetical protein J6B56_00290 [Clostridia bacterium]|nr:hypothetical protein [Clostridia bacterium]
MAKKTRTSGASQRYAYMKQRITKMQGKAKAFGFLYLLATIALAALACMPLIIWEESIGVKLGVMEFWTVFTKLGEGIQGKELELIVAVIYGLMLFALVVNVLRSVFKLGWLFKKKASRLYGFNRNMYAMDDMGRRFSSSFAVIVCAHFLLMLILGEGTLQPTAFVALGVGVFFHFACGIPAGNVSLFNTENGVIEQRRELGNFSPFVRNLFQLIIVAGVAYFFLGCAQIRSTLDLLLAENGLTDLMADPLALITPALHLLILVLWIGMVYYATGTIEFDPDGAEAAGRKRFLALSVLLLLCAGGAFAYGQFVAQTAVHQNVIIITAIALVAVVLELVLIKCPKEETENLDEVDSGAYLTENYDKPGVYINSAAVNAPDFGYPAEVNARRK